MTTLLAFLLTYHVTTWYLDQYPHPHPYHPHQWVTP